MKTIRQIILSAFIGCVFQLNNSVAQVTVSLSVYQPVCNHDGIIVATVQNALPSITYSWYANGLGVIHNTTSTTDTIFNFTGGYIGVSVQDGSGTFGYDNILVNFPLTVSYNVVPDTCPLQTGEITLNVSGGTTPYSYAWTFNGNPFGGNTSSLTGLQGGYYDCLITENGGCNMYLHEMDSFAGGILIPSVNNIITNLSTTPANCTNGTASVSPSGGTPPYSYLWSTGQTTSSIAGLFANSYHSVTITDMNGCFKMGYAYIPSSVTITINQSVTPAHCTFSDGAITAIPVNGTSPYSYLWSTGATTNSINNIPAGNYTVSVTDMNGCQQSMYINVISLTPVNVSYSTSPSQCTSPTGSATANVTGGTTPYSYLWYTTPPQITSVASNLAAGNYNVLVTDAQGCTRGGTVTIPQNTTLNQVISFTSPVCSALNGSASMNATGGIAPLSYLWSDGQTTSSATGIGTGLIHGTVTDAAGCSVPGSVWIPYYSPMTLSITTNIASCIFTNDGSITVVPQNGTPPYQYHWSDGSTTQTASNLLPGYYSVYVTDANGCNEWSGLIYLGYNQVAPCSGIISGRVFIDLNGDCQYGNSEPYLENIPILCHETGQIIFTNFWGQFSFVVPTGNVTIEQLPLPYRFQSCQAGPYVINVPSPGVYIQQDIADTVLFVNDLTTEVYNYTQPVVGGDFVQAIIYGNAGTLTLPYTQQYDYDSQCPFSYASVTPSVLNTAQHLAEWNSPAIAPLHYARVDVTHNIPQSVPINTNIFFSDTIFPYNGDTTWWNNYDYDYLTTLGSYDPNYKEVSPRGSGPLGFISQSDSVLEYVIHFQNIGNYYANNIVILDTLDSDLDWNSLRLGYSTHQHTTEITSAGMLIMRFDNINLPSIVQDTVGSNGFAVYTIHLKPNLANGTQIKNSAGIYFDQNVPVITNTTLNTIQITGIEEQQIQLNYSLSPNPTNGILTIRFKENKNEYLVKVNNMLGQEIYSVKHNPSEGINMNLDLSKFSDGMYIVQISAGNISTNSKIILRH